jgi:hypothetical protein
MSAWVSRPGAVVGLHDCLGYDRRHVGRTPAVVDLERANGAERRARILRAAVAHVGVGESVSGPHATGAAGIREAGDGAVKAAIADHHESPVPGRRQVDAEAGLSESFLVVAGDEVALDPAVLRNRRSRRLQRCGGNRRRKAVRSALAAVGVAVRIGVLVDDREGTRSERRAGRAVDRGRLLRMETKGDERTEQCAIHDWRHQTSAGWFVACSDHDAGASSVARGATTRPFAPNI